MTGVRLSPRSICKFRRADEEHPNQLYENGWGMAIFD
jgi:hypothetical protein